jgi:hypothetical protein
MVWCSHMWWQEALCMILVQITPKNNSMNVAVCRNPTQTSRNLAGHIVTCCLVCVTCFGCGLHGLVLPHMVAGSTLYGFSANNPKKQQYECYGLHQTFPNKLKSFRAHSCIFLSVCTMVWMWNSWFGAATCGGRKHVVWF